MTVNVDAASIASFVLIVLAWIHGNKRIDDLGKRVDDQGGNLNKRIDDLKSIVQAEAAATRSEFRATREVLEEQIKSIR